MRYYGCGFQDVRRMTRAQALKALANMDTVDRFIDGVLANARNR